MERVRQAFAVQANPSINPAQIKEATVWLEKFQATQEAWQVADQLLAQPAPAGSTGALVLRRGIGVRATLDPANAEPAGFAPAERERARHGAVLGATVFDNRPGARARLARISLSDG